eukprot:gi/632975766/ref/XP_007904412.1/ PREDICTED: peroxisome proliferator-activated receptor gamma coactivator 1-beta-like isoform X5 [Callorhinchus milii]
MAECGLTDEDLSLFVFNYLAEGAEPQSGCGASAEDRLYSDFPEIDLSQLDVNDLDTGSCLGELQWDSEQSDISSSHYSTDGSELFQIIEEENEALLAALTATLGDIAVDDVSLSAFGVEAEQLGAVSSPAPPVSQPDEASLLRKLLLAPQSAQLTYERQKGSRVSRHGAGNRKPQSRRPFLKEEEGGGKANSTCQHRPFTELHKYLTSATCPPQLKAAGSHLSNTDPSNPGWTTQHHQSHHQQVEDPRACTAQDLPLNANKMQEAKTSRKLAKPTSLLLSPESESDSKDSPLENKAFEQTLSVELCGTAGLTPPTTPPHKTARDDPFKSALKIAPGGGHEVNRSLSPKRLVKKQLEDTELYAYLSKAAVVPAQGDGRKGKRAYSRCFGDHDYCQLYSSEPEPDRKVLRLWELPRHSGQHSLKAKCDPYGEKRQKLSPAHGHGPNTEQLEQNKTLLGQSSNKKTMKDQEIRAKLYQHFGYPEQALPEEEKQHMLEDNERDSDSHYRCSDQRQGERVKKPGANPESQPPPPSGSSHPDPQPQLRTTLPADGILSGRSAPSPQRSHSSGSPQSRSPERPESVRDDDGDRYLLEGQNLEEGEFFEKTNQRDKRNLAIDEHRIVYVGKLTCGMTRSEVMRRFEAFGEIEECKVLACEKGDQYGLVTYRYSHDASLALENGHDLQKQNDPALQLYYGALRRFCKASYTNLDCSAEDLEPAPVKSKYDTMDFDSLLKEAQRSLTR